MFIARLSCVFAILAVASSALAKQTNARQFVAEYKARFGKEFPVNKAALKSVEKFVSRANHLGHGITKTDMPGYRALSPSGRTQRLLGYQELGFGHFKKIIRPGLDNMIVPLKQGMAFLTNFTAKKALELGGKKIKAGDKVSVNVGVGKAADGKKIVQREVLVSP